RKVTKIFGYAETIVPYQFPEDFKSNFRPRRTCVERLVTLLTPWVQVPRRRPAIDVTKQTLVFVWSLANLKCFSSVVYGDRFGLSDSTVCRVVHRVGLAVLAHGPNFVSWPTEKKALHIISGFEAKAGFLGVLGGIDGSHIVCK
ncbi:hypothetical protein IscW_ISCW024326, partial [Ixodes scapularis]